MIIYYKPTTGEIVHWRSRESSVDASLSRLVVAGDQPPKGKKVVSGALVDTSSDTDVLSKKARAQRDDLLRDSDWTQVPDAPTNKTAWATYRQALRDIPDQEGFPSNITWPTPP